MEKSSQIASLLRSIVGTDRLRPAFLTMEVTAVDGDMCSAKLGDFEIPDIRLSVIKDGSKKGLLISPAIGSIVLVADLSGGEMRELAVIGFTDIDSIDLKVSGADIHMERNSIELNSGNNGGIVKIEPLKTNLEMLQSFIENLQALTATALAPLASLDGGASVTAYNSAFQAAKAGVQMQNMENQNVTH